MGGGCELPNVNSNSEEISALLKSAKTVAVVGLSPKPERDSFRVAKYLQDSGYRIIPVRPKSDEILGEKCFDSVDDIPDPVDIVNVFRAPEHAPSIAEAAVRKGAKALWLQEGIVNNAAAAKAREAGLIVVQSRCILKAHQALQ